MKQLSNKIQIPVKTKIVAIFAGTMALLYGAILLAIADEITTIWPAWVFLGYGFTAFGLLKKWKCGWYVGLGTFGAMVIFWINTIIGRDFAQTDILFLLATMAAFVFLLIDRKKFFAAAGN